MLLAQLLATRQKTPSASLPSPCSSGFSGSLSYPDARTLVWTREGAVYHTLSFAQDISAAVFANLEGSYPDTGADPSAHPAVVVFLQDCGFVFFSSGQYGPFRSPGPATSTMALPQGVLFQAGPSNAFHLLSGMNVSGVVSGRDLQLRGCVSWGGNGSGRTKARDMGSETPKANGNSNEGAARHAEGPGVNPKQNPLVTCFTRPQPPLVAAIDRARRSLVLCTCDRLTAPEEPRPDAAARAAAKERVRHRLLRNHGIQSGTKNAPRHQRPRLSLSNLAGVDERYAGVNADARILPSARLRSAHGNLPRHSSTLSTAVAPGDACILPAADTRVPPPSPRVVPPASPPSQNLPILPETSTNTRASLPMGARPSMDGLYPPLNAATEPLIEEALNLEEGVLRRTPSIGAAPAPRPVEPTPEYELRVVFETSLAELGYAADSDDITCFTFDADASGCIFALHSRKQQLLVLFQVEGDAPNQECRSDRSYKPHNMDPNCGDGGQGGHGNEDWDTHHSHGKNDKSLAGNEDRFTDRNHERNPVLTLPQNSKRSSKPSLHPKSHTDTPTLLRRISDVSFVAPAYVSRAKTQDLVLLSKTGAWAALGRKALHFRLPAFPLHQSHAFITSLSSPSTSILAVKYANGESERIQLPPPAPSDDLLADCLSVLPVALSPSAYSQLQSTFYAVYYQAYTAGREVSFATHFTDVFFSEFCGGKVSPPGNSDLLLLRSAFSSGDPLLAWIDEKRGNPTKRPLSDGTQQQSPRPSRAAKDNTNRGSRSSTLPNCDVLERVLLCFETLFQVFRLRNETLHKTFSLAGFLFNLASHLSLPHWADIYRRYLGYVTAPLPDAVVPLDPALKRPPVDIFEKLSSLLFCERSTTPPADLYVSSDCDPSALLKQVSALYEGFVAPHSSSRERSRVAIELMHSYGWTAHFITGFAPPVQVAFLEAIRVFENDPPDNWSPALYQLIRRPDLAKLASEDEEEEVIIPKHVLQETPKPLNISDIFDHADKILALQTKQFIATASDDAPVPQVTRFSEDRRLDEIHRLLQYSDPVMIKANAKVADGLTPNIQQIYLQSLSNRTIALPVGYGMFKYKTRSATIHEAIDIPSINTSARILPMTSLIHLQEKEQMAPHIYANSKYDWPEYASGVAKALEVCQNGIDSSQITFNKPSDLNHEHAGFLMGLGLMGHMDSLQFNQTFEYLKSKHDSTTIGILLGLAATYIGTQDAKVTSLLSVYIAALHPSNSAALNISLITQSAGVLSLGLLYFGSGKKAFSNAMLREMTRMTVQNVEEASSCREAYALSAGFSYGLMMIGKGNKAVGAAEEIDLLRTFRVLISGNEASHALPGESAKGAIDFAITSPAATVALGLTFLRTGRCDVAEMFEIPGSLSELNLVRPDLLVLRVTMKILVMWDDARPTKRFVESFVPRFLNEYLEEYPSKGGDNPTLYDLKPSAAMYSEADIVKLSILTGACFGLGLRYAGTGNAEAEAVLMYYYDRLASVAFYKTTKIGQRLKRFTIRNLLSVLATSLALVMAGSGDINTLRRFRLAHNQVGESVIYGTHLAVSMSIGALFLGGGSCSFGRSDRAIASLLIAFFPVYPATSSTNSFHLQAYRHLWALAAEPRCLHVRDIDTNEPCFLPVKITLKPTENTWSDKSSSKRDERHEGPPHSRQKGDSSSQEEQSSARARNGPGHKHTATPPAHPPLTRSLICPTLIPDIDSIESIQVSTPRYWPLTIRPAENSAFAAHFRNFPVVYVRRRMGHLGYAADPRGTRSIFARSRSETGSVVSDFGELSALLAPSVSGLREFVECFSDERESIATVRHLAGGTGPNPSARKHDSGVSGGNPFAAPISDDSPESSRSFAPTPFQAFSASVLLECLTRDKPECIQIYYKFYHTYMQLQARHPTPQALAHLNQLKAVVFAYNKSILKTLFYHMAHQPEGQPHSEPLLRRGFYEYAVSKFANIAQDLASDALLDALDGYARHSKWPVDEALATRFALYAELQSLPSLGVLQELKELCRRDATDSTKDQSWIENPMSVELRLKSMAETLELNGYFAWSWRIGQFLAEMLYEESK